MRKLMPPSNNNLRIDTQALAPHTKIYQLVQSRPTTPTDDHAKNNILEKHPSVVMVQGSTPRGYGQEGQQSQRKSRCYQIARP
mmetsp:Transcript_3797/g.8540  ORF Transcript_3797/g.8540 Transcript_3797/m.8540 type:complete len:83 (-) Transcript_3797:1883-2131(-)